MYSVFHFCFPQLDMSVTGAHYQLYTGLFQRAVDFSGVTSATYPPDSSLEVSRALHGTLHMPHTFTVNLFELYE